MLKTQDTEPPQKIMIMIFIPIILQKEMVCALTE